MELRSSSAVVQQTISFKFVEQIDIDTLIGGEYFKINREEMLDDEKRIEYFGCHLKCIRQHCGRR